MKNGRRYRCVIAERLEAIAMSAAEREAAKASLNQGVLIAELMLHVAAMFRSTTSRIGRGFRGLARHTQ